MFTINELLEATKGKLLGDSGNTTVRGISIDSRTIRPNELFIAIKGNNFDGHDFIGQAIKKKSSCIIKDTRSLKGYQEKFQKNKKITFIEVKDTRKALGDIALSQRNKFNIPVIAITGSNGKTTTKEMIAWILSKRFKVLKNEGTKNNHIGLSLTLLNLKAGYDMAVLELGTNHFGEIDYLSQICLPNVGVITNIGPAHLEHFHNLKEVFREKYTLIKNLNRPSVAILNVDDIFLRRLIIKKIKKPVILGFGIKQRSDFLAADIKVLNEKIEFLVNPAPLQRCGANSRYRFTSLDRHSKINDAYRRLTRFRLKTMGYYNTYNALAAITVARIFGFGYKDIVSRLATFDFPQSRLKTTTFKNIRFIDDTYNSNPVSLRQALGMLDNFKIKGKKIFIMGDMLELGDSGESFHYHAGRQAARICNVFITVGELSKLAAKEACACGFDRKNIFICQSSQEAGDILFNKIRPKKTDIVLIKGSRLMKMEEVFR